MMTEDEGVSCPVFLRALASSESHQNIVQSQEAEGCSRLNIMTHSLRNRLTLLSADARACRIIASICFLASIYTLLIAVCVKHERQRKGTENINLAHTETMLHSKPGKHSFRTGTSQIPNFFLPEQTLTRQALQVDVATTNVTVILESIQVEGSEDSSAPWMYSETSSPFERSENPDERVHAFTKLSWNPNGTGNGSCESEGSGKVSRGYLDPYNYNMKVEQDVDFDNIRVELRNLSLTDFEHINTVYRDNDWAVMGQAGDKRQYDYGSFRILEGDKLLLEVSNVQFFQNVSYPAPVGETPDGGIYVGGYILGEINEFTSDEHWLSQLDPFGMGYILGIVSAASLGPQACITANSYWLTLRGLPDMKRPTVVAPYVVELFNDTKRSGAKTGIYMGSTVVDIERAESLANTSRYAVTSAVSVGVASAAGSAAAAMIFPGAIAAPPGQGMFRLISNTAFVSQVNEVHGFHSEAMATFGDGMKPFLGKIEFPFKSETLAESRFGRWFMKTVDLFGRSEEDLSAIARQQTDEFATVSDELFGGCAFYTSLIVIGFLFVHLMVWLSTRKKPIGTQLSAHAWMIYIFSIVMSYVYTASVLNSLQYLRSHLFNGTGKIGLYIVAFLQLLFVGVGFTVFFTIIMVLAAKRVRTEKVKWVPRNQIPSPKMRKKGVIAGEYQVGDQNMFHTLFECYYSSMAGPRLWLAGIEMFVVFLDAICTATIWNEVICFAILVGVYATLFMLFLTFAPFVDTIEGRLVTTLGLIDLVLLIVEFMGSLADYETAEEMEKVGVILGFVSIGVAVLIAVYCDLIPMAMRGFKFLRRKLRGRFGRHRETGEESELSAWSVISKSNASDLSVASQMDDEEEKQVVSEHGSFRGLLTQIFKSQDGRDSRQDRADRGGATSSFDWRRVNRGINWQRGGGDVTSSTPTSDGKLRILNSEDSDDAIEWPMVGHVIYSVRDLHRNADSEGYEEEGTDEDEGLIHVREEPR